MKVKSICFKRWLFSAALLFIGMGLVMAQEVKISGVVTAKEDGLPMPGVSVFVKGTTNGTITDFDGNYHLAASQGAVVVYSFIGMTTQEIAVGATTTINVVMQSDATDLDEVVVTALGIKRETKKLGYAMTEVKGDQISGANTVNPIQALQGKSTGLSIGASDGGLFGNSKVQLRGVSVLNSNNNQPIFVIDGVILENAVSNASADWDASSNDFGNILKNLNADDFESVSVLKGAAATALYGSRGINGAIVIKTKDGKGSKGIGVKVSQSIGLDYVYKQPDLQYEFGPGVMASYVNYGDQDASGQYYKYSTNQFYKNSDGIPTKKSHPYTYGWGPRFDGRPLEDYDGSMTTYSPVKNHMKDAYELGVNSNTSVALTGGNEHGTFYLSDSYNHRTGTLPTNSYERNALQFTGSYKLAKWLNADASISFTTSKSKNPWNDFGEQFLNTELVNWYDSELWNKKSVYQAVHGGLPSAKYGDKYAYVPGNALWFNYNMNSLSQREQVTRPVVRLTADLTSWISLTAEGNMNVYNTTTEGKTLGTDYANEGDNGSYRLSSSNDVSKTFKFLANIKKQITDDINSNLIVGTEFWDQRKEYSNIKTDGGLIVPGKYFLGNSRKTVNSEGKIFGTKQINSFYFLFNTGWKDQVFLDITGRNDWSSALVYTDGTGNFSYFYPSVSTSWIFSETFEMPHWVSFGKLRASFAQVGNDTNPYDINRGYSVDKMELAGGAFVYTNAKSISKVDSDIKPEKKNSFELGLDLRLLNNRVGLDATYYHETVNNQIGNIPLPEESGYNEMLTNIGSLRTEGVELSLKLTPIKRRDFEWNSTINWWKSNTTILDLRKETGAFKLLGGSPAYGNFRIGSVAYENGDYGVLMSDSKPMVWKSDNASDPRNGMKVLSWSDARRGAYYTRSGQLEEVGKILPDFEGSWDNSFSYKNLSVSVLIDARFGGHIASYSNRYGTAYGFLETSLRGRDAQEGGLGWTSGYADSKGQSFNDGVIPDGVFAEGQNVTTPNGTQVDVGGMTYQEAYDKGYVEPTHASYFTFRNNDWNTGVVNSDWVSEVNYVALRNISIGYNLPKTVASKIKAQSLYVGLNARNLCYLYNSLPNHLNPESFRGTTSSESFLERSFTPYTATYTMSVNISF